MAIARAWLTIAAGHPVPVKMRTAMDHASVAAGQNRADLRIYAEGHNHPLSRFNNSLPAYARLTKTERLNTGGSHRLGPIHVQGSGLWGPTGANADYSCSDASESCSLSYARAWVKARVGVSLRTCSSQITPS